MTYKYRGEYTGGPEWGATPQEAEVSITDDLYSRIATVQAFLKEHGLAYAQKWYTGGYKFFMEDGNGNLVERDPDYRTDGCHLRIYADGNIMFEFPLKHGNDSETGFLGSFHYSEGVHE